MNNIYYVIDRTDDEFWDINKFKDVDKALNYKNNNPKVTVTCNKMEVLELLLYALVHKILYRIGECYS